MKRLYGYTFKELFELGPRAYAKATGLDYGYVRRMMLYRDTIQATIAAGKIEYRQRHPRYHERWSLGEDRQLRRLTKRAVRAGLSWRNVIGVVAAQLGRNPGGVESRLSILCLVDKYVDVEVARRMRGRA